MAIVGVASVRIKPDLTEFRKELNEGLKAMRAEVTVKVRADTRPAREAVDMFRAGVRDMDFTADIDADTTKARTQVAAFKKGLDFKESLRSLNDGLRTATASMTRFAVAGAAFSVIQSSASTLGPLLVSAAGAAALIPGALLAGAAAIAAIKLGADGAKRAFEGLKPTIDALKTSVSASFEKALVPAVNNLKSILPSLTGGFQQIATSIGGVATKITGLLKAPAQMGSLKTILGETSKVIQNLGSFLAPVIAAFVNIGAIGLPIIREMTTGIGAAGQSFLKFTQSAEGAAKIQQIIRTAIDAFRQLFQIIGQVIQIFSTLFTGLSSGAGSLSGTLLPALQAINSVLSSPAIMNALKGIGEALATVGKAVGQTLGPVIQTVLPLLSQALQAAAPGISALVSGIGELIKGIAPALPAVGQLASVLGSGLGQVASALGPVLGKLAGVLADTLAKVIPPLVPIITQLVDAIGAILIAVAPLIGPIVQLATAALKPILQIVQALIPPFTTLINSVLKAIEPIIPVISDAFTQLGNALAPLAGALGNAIVEIFKALLPAVGPLVTAVVALVQAFIPFIPVITNWISIATPILALVAQLIAMFIQFQAQAITPIINIFGVFSSAVSSAMQKVQSIIQSVVNAVTGFFSGLLNSITSTWNNIYNRVTSSVTNIKNGITNGFGAAVDFVRSIPGRILDALGDLGGMLYRAGRSIIDGLVRGIKSAIGAVTDAVGGVLSAARNLLPFSPAKTGPFSGKGWTLYSGRSISEALAKGISDRARLAIQATEQMMTGIQNATSSTAGFGSTIDSSVSAAVNAAASFDQAPIQINVSGDEGVMRDFIQVEVDENNRGVRRLVKSGVPAWQ